MRLGLLRNNTTVAQSFGTYEIPARSIGRVPHYLIEDLRRHPMVEFTVVEDDPAAQIFERTKHKPFNPRWKT